MSKMLITGGAGFIGLSLARHFLGKGYPVDIIDNFSRGNDDVELREFAENKNTNLLNLDLLNIDSYRKLDKDYEYIFHLAAIIGVQNVLNKPYSVLKDNVLMLTNVIDYARSNSRLKRLLFASTSEVYAGTLKFFSLPLPTPENTPIALTELEHPRTSYMLSKIYGEALCQQSGIPFTIFRPHNIYGPRMGMSHVIPELLKKCVEATSGKLPVYSTSHKRTFCYIDDAVNMISNAAMMEECRNQTLNVGSLEGEITIENLAKIVIKTVGKEMLIEPMPETPGSPTRRCPDMSKTTILTGYKPVVSVEDGVRKTYEWYKENVFRN